jgi:hypothetical protein
MCMMCREKFKASPVRLADLWHGAPRAKTPNPRFPFRRCPAPPAPAPAPVPLVTDSTRVEIASSFCNYPALGVQHRGVCWRWRSGFRCAPKIPTALRLPTAQLSALLAAGRAWRCPSRTSTLSAHSSQRPGLDSVCLIGWCANCRARAY